MAKLYTLLKFYGILVLVAALSSFTIISASDSSKSEEHSTEKDVSSSDDSQGNNKEKRSREEILFGNQQNKPNGLVDDLMSMPESGEDDTKDDKKKDSKDEAEEQNGQLSSKDESDEKREAGSEDERNMMASDSDNWYNTVPVSSTALQYLANAPALQSLPSRNFANSLYDQEDVYRRKRQLLGQPLPLRRRRSLRASLGQMIQQRGLRMPRRSMRLKRQVDLYSLLGNEAFYDDQGQVPGHLRSYPQTPAPEFRYPYRAGPLDDELEFDDNQNENAQQGLNFDDMDSLMLLHPNARYIERPEVALFPYRTPDEENEAFQKWLGRYAIPNTFRVSRRSSPTFYPLDYRYIPGYKKRNIFTHGNRMTNRFSGNNDEVEPEQGTWGHVVQVPEAYASPEDVARLYGLASLMAEGDEEEKAKRAA